MPASYSQILRQTREAKGLDIKECSKALKIRTDYLIAFETNDFDTMPPRGYTRNMLNTYARFLGLDPNMIINQYLDESYSQDISHARTSYSTYRNSSSQYQPIDSNIPRHEPLQTDRFTPVPQNTGSFRTATFKAPNQYQDYDGGFASESGRIRVDSGQNRYPNPASNVQGLGQPNERNARRSRTSASVGDAYGDNRQARNRNQHDFGQPRNYGSQREIGQPQVYEQHQEYDQSQEHGQIRGRKQVQGNNQYHEERDFNKQNRSRSNGNKSSHKPRSGRRVPTPSIPTGSGKVGKHPSSLDRSASNMYATGSKASSSAGRRSAKSGSRIPLLAGIIIICLLLIVAFALFSRSNNNTSSENLPKVNISGLSDPDANTEYTAPDVQPTCSIFSYEVPEGNDVYIELYFDSDKPKVATTISGPKSESYNVTGKFKFVTVRPHAITIRVDGQDVKPTDDDDDGIYTYEFDFADVLNKWLEEHPEADKSKENTDLTLDPNAKLHSAAGTSV